MKLENILVQSYSLPSKSKFVTACKVFNQSNRLGYKVLVKDRLGHFGYGEAAPLPDWGMETLVQTAQALTKMSERLLGAIIKTTERDTDQILELLADYAATPAARHGMELAILDLFAQSQNLSIAQLLNANSATKVEVNGLVGAESLAETVRQTSDLVKQGYRCLKLKIGRMSWEDDLVRIKAVRKEVGSEIKLRLDPNQSWHIEQAIAYIRELAPLGIEYIEQPLPAQDLLGMAKLRKLGIIAIAADEAVQNLTQLAQVIKAEAADLVILKPMALGGILTSFKAAQIALDAGLAVVITTSLDGAIARLGALHLAAALPKLSHACGLATGHLLAEDLCDRKILISLSQNPIQLNSLPGLGLKPEDIS
jgi:o-succinylbenzoate synthase